MSLDKQGWVEVEKLLFALTSREKWSKLLIADIEFMIENATKKRHEIKGGKIRALYGHSTSEKISKDITEPPEYLYHGTAREFLKAIQNGGLISKGRQYVHLSVDMETAFKVGSRRDKEPIILVIYAKEAFDGGVNFYFGHENIWLSDFIPNKYIILTKETNDRNNLEI